jgi:hypothetical protein
MKTLSWLALALPYPAGRRRRATLHRRTASPLDHHGLHVGRQQPLRTYIVKDIELELGLAGSTPRQDQSHWRIAGPGYDRSRGDWQTTKLYYVTQGIVADAAHAVADWGERNFGDPRR